MASTGITVLFVCIPAMEGSDKYRLMVCKYRAGVVTPTTHIVMGVGSGGLGWCPAFKQLQKLGLQLWFSDSGGCRRKMGTK